VRLPIGRQLTKSSIKSCCHALRYSIHFLKVRQRVRTKLTKTLSQRVLKQ
jgi:hypothetical protein